MKSKNQFDSLFTQVLISDHSSAGESDDSCQGCKGMAGANSNGNQPNIHDNFACFPPATLLGRSFSPALLASTDIISQFFNHLFIWVGNLTPAAFHFSIKAFLLFLMPYLLCVFYMRRHQATVFSQVTLAVAGILIVGAIPVDRLEIANSMLKTWLWLGCSVALLFLPRLLASVVVPTIGAQRRLTIGLYILLIILFLLNNVEPAGK